MVFVRNVKFSVAECNSFNIRKKNVEDLASKKFCRGSHEKKQLLECKEASIKMQRSNFWNVKKQASRYKEATFGMQRSKHQDTKWQLLEYKEAGIKIQSGNFWSVKLQQSGCHSKYFQFQPDMPSTYQPLTPY